MRTKAMRISRAANGMLTYRYTAGGCMEFAFHTLAEVGAPYQQEARAIIRANGWTVRYNALLPSAPYVADIAVPPTRGLE